MSVQFILSALFLISAVTNLTVEGCKKILDSLCKKYSANILAAIVSIVVSIVISVIYLVLNDIPFDVKVGILIFILMYLSFLTATVGYDKVIQTITQLRGIKDDK